MLGYMARPDPVAECYTKQSYSFPIPPEHTYKPEMVHNVTCFTEPELDMEQSECSKHVFISAKVVLVDTQPEETREARCRRRHCAAGSCRPHGISQ